jgi:Gram-negative bacterial TonB protein C-terminal
VGCKSAAPRAQPQAGPGRPDPLAGYVGRTVILRHVGDQPKASLKRAELTSARGDCDVVAEVRQARFDRGTAVFTLHPVGRPRLTRRGARQERCGDDQAQVVLTVSGFDPGAAAADLEAGLAAVLQTPEAYMAARGLTFDIPAGKPPVEPTPDHFITVRPVRLMWFDPIRQDAARRVRHEGEVEVEGVVGADGRLYDVRLLTVLGSEDEQRVRALLPLWRFEPGRRGNDRAPVKVRERLVFRIFY